MAKRFFDFMESRERIRLKKERGEAWPWCDDPILREFKFTNVKREHDRTTVWMRKNWTGPNTSDSDGNIIFNCALFRYFGTIRCAQIVGWQKSWKPDAAITRIETALSCGESIFTGAYIIPTLGKKSPKHRVIVNEVLTPLWKVREEIGLLARSTKSWRIVGERLMTLPGFGGTGFLAKEVLQDVLHTPVLNDAFDRNSWCPIGPGAQRGLNRVMNRDINTRVPFASALSELIELYRRASMSLPSWMPELELHDIQFQLCEFDKYERTRLGQGRPKSRYRFIT